MQHIKTQEPSSTKTKLKNIKNIPAEHYPALGAGLVKLSKKILFIILYPFIWFRREFGRFREFLSINTARPLTDNEWYFVCSWPIFLVVIGSLLGLILGIIGYFINTAEFLAGVNTALRPFQGIANLITDIYHVLVIIFSTIWNALSALNDFILANTFYTKNISIPFTLVAIIELIVLLGLLAFTESKVFAVIMKYVNKVLTIVYKTLYKFFKGIHSRIWHFLIYKVGRAIMGGKRMDNYNITFFKKLLIATFLFSFVVFFGGLLIFIGQQNLVSFRDALVSIAYLILMLFIAGVIAGIPVTYAYMRFLSLSSGYRYYLKTTETTTQVTETTK